MPNATSLVRPEVLALAPYNAGLTIQEVVERYAPPRIAKLGSNESPLGPTSAIQELTAYETDLLRLYPDPRGRMLRRAIGAKFAVAEEQVVLGNGSEDLISVICRTILRPADRVITLYPSFPLHEDYATVLGARVERVSLAPDFVIDVDALIAAVQQPARLLIFSNPMNPVGSTLSEADLRHVIAATPPEVLIVIDEAYGEYAREQGMGSAVSVFKSLDRPWMVLRTFSKAYGLAGLRLGFGIADSPAFAEVLDRVRTPFNANAVAQIAALKALADDQHLAEVTALARLERERIDAFLRDRGYRTAPSAANFVFFDCRRSSTDFAEDLLRHGVIVKPWKQLGFETFIRVTAGSRNDSDQFMQAIRDITPA
jgi:histidinol-phosphate aminotransferase